MKTLTDEKLTIVGAAGMIGSNMAQTAIMMGLTSNICLYDPYAPGLEGVAEELFHCGFEGVNITFTSDIKEALTGAKYIVNSGGAARKAGMTREDLLKGNAAIAEEFGKNVKAYCPDVKHIVVIFNPADITGLITLLYSGLKPSQVTTLAALDSTRLRSELAKHFGISMDQVENCRTYGGHGEQMAVVVFLTMVIVFFMSKPISAYQLGETYAQNMGVNIKVFRILLILLSSILSACVTAFAGPISFVGIAVPHIAKSLLKTAKPLLVIPACFLGGAVFCLFCDLIARTVFAPTELSISSVTAVFGAPVVIYIMIRRQQRI